MNRTASAKSLLCRIGLCCDSSEGRSDRLCQTGQECRIFGAASGVCFHKLAPFRFWMPCLREQGSCGVPSASRSAFFQKLSSLGLVVRSVTCVNRVLHLVFCHIHSSLSAPLQISASAASLMDAVIHPVSNVAAQFLARFGRKEQRHRSTYAGSHGKSQNRSWNLFSVHRQSLSNTVFLHFPKIAFRKKRRKSWLDFLPFGLLGSTRGLGGHVAIHRSFSGRSNIFRARSFQNILGALDFLRSVAMHGE
jgi:hypothetical protein